MDPITLASLGVGLLGSVGKMFGRGAANRRLAGLSSQMPQYKENPLVAQQLAMTQALLNARMPGATAAEKNIYQTQANQIAAAERAATDPNQLLLAGAGATGTANQAFNQLGQLESQDYQRRYANLAAAQNAQVAEQQRVYEDQLRRYQMMAQLQGAQNENLQNTWGDISNLGFTGSYLANLGLFDKTKKKDLTGLGTMGIGNIMGTGTTTKQKVRYYNPDGTYVDK